jgi:hypothetical protein
VITRVGVAVTVAVGVRVPVGIVVAVGTAVSEGMTVTVCVGIGSFVGVFCQNQLAAWQEIPIRISGMRRNILFFKET